MKDLTLPVIGVNSKLEMYYLYLKHLTPILGITYKSKDVVVLASIMDYINTNKGSFKDRKELGEHLCSKEAKKEIRVNANNLYKTKSDKLKNSIELDFFDNILSSLRKKGCFENIKIRSKTRVSSPIKSVLLANKTIFNVVYSDEKDLSLTFKFKLNEMGLAKE